ncbi:MAG: hypothetical protein JXA67_09980 [Micromonosporaceae bacterium]|nr:hypothetical protein [Micromonosporaceae bacterium]
MSSEGRYIPEVGLDDLFGRTGTLPVARQGIRSPGARWLLGRLFLAGAGSAVIYSSLYFLGLVIPFALILVVVFVAAWLKHLLGWVAAPPLPPQITGRGIRPLAADAGDAPLPAEDDRDGVAVAVGEWAGRLAVSGGGASGRSTIVASLGDLADERLRLRHGITRASDPQRAREMMGEHLWRMLHNPSAGGPTPRDMEVFIQRIEEL